MNVSSSPTSRVSRIAGAFNTARSPPGSRSSSSTRSTNASSSSSPTQSQTHTTTPPRTARGSIKDLIKAFDQPASPLKPTRTPKASAKPIRKESESPRSLPVNPKEIEAPVLPPKPPEPPVIFDHPAVPTVSLLPPPQTASIESMIPPYISDFAQRRIFPVLAGVIALHVVSPRLSCTLWGLIFRIILQKSPPSSKKSQQLSADYTQGIFNVLLPIAVLLVAGLIFTRPPPKKEETSGKVASRRSSVEVVGSELKVSVMESVELLPNALNLDPPVETTPKDLPTDLIPAPIIPSIPERIDSIQEEPQGRAKVELEVASMTLSNSPSVVRSPTLKRNKPLPVPEAEAEVEAEAEAAPISEQPPLPPTPLQPPPLVQPPPPTQPPPPPNYPPPTFIASSPIPPRRESIPSTFTPPRNLDSQSRKSSLKSTGSSPNTMQSDTEKKLPSSSNSIDHRRNSDGPSFDNTIDSQPSTLRNPSFVESIGGRNSNFLESLNESLGDSFMTEATTVKSFKSVEASPRQSGKQLPSPPPIHLREINALLEAKPTIADFVPLDSPPSSTFRKPLSPETTPKPEFHETPDDDSISISNIDEDTLNAILYNSLHSQPSPLISDHELSKLFPLPQQQQQQQQQQRVNQFQLPTSPRLPRKLSPRVPRQRTSSTMFNNPNATSLEFISMNLSSLPIQFAPLLNLTRLHLAGNNLYELPDPTMSLMPSLKFLDVSDNKISCLTRGVGSCRGLRELYARNCGMVVIEEGCLEGLQFLEVLDLSSNNLSSFSNFAFAHNTSKLHTLILSNNKLRTLPPSLGLHRGRELVFLLIGGNPFEHSLKLLTDPIISASQAIIPRVTKDISNRLAVVPDDASFSGSISSNNRSFAGLGLNSSASSALDKSDQGSLYEWDDDDVKSIHDAEFDSNLNVFQGYNSKPTDFSRLRRRSSLPDVKRSDSRRFTAGRRGLGTDLAVGGRDGGNVNASGGGAGGWDQMEASSSTSYHASTNPSYVYIQRLLSHLRDVFDLTPAFHPIKIAIERVSNASDSRPGSKQGMRDSNSSNERREDDPNAPHLTEEERERIRKRQSPTRRAHIAAEVLSTERTYVNELKTLVSLYADPLERGILSSADMGAMFSNLKSILYFHKSHLLPNIERAIQDPTQPLGSIFNEAAPFFKMYSLYYNNFDTANEFVIHLDQLATSGTGQLQTPIKSTVLASTSISPTASTQTSRRTLAKKFKNMVKIAKSSPSHTQISLQSYLILPVQRLPRYKLLVDQLLESTPLNHPDRADLQTAADAIRACVAECNDKKREMEEHERGLKQMARIRTMKAKSTGAISKFSHIHMAGLQRQFVRESAFRLVKFVERQQVSGDSGGSGMADLQFAMIGNRDRYFKSLLGTVVETRFAMGGGNNGAVSSTAPPVNVFGQPHLGAGLDGMSVYGVQRTLGGEFRFLLFTDVLCWCKPISGSNSSPLSGSNASSSILDAEFELIRAIDIGPHTKVESMCILAPDSHNGNGIVGSGGSRFADRNSMASNEHLRGYIPGPPVKTQRLSGLYGGSNLAVTNSRGSATLPTTPIVRELESVLRISDNDSVLYLRGTQTEIISWEEALKGLGCDGGGEY
ncbi:UNVERIFIED_CONTAM: hypothetical protein HDU68_004981 [Siphonaria sp. JEL0065]|nr:hypothetical protein HDU68_004981 [Siphonaria sp. JEL0065]